MIKLYSWGIKRSGKLISGIAFSIYGMAFFAIKMNMVMKMLFMGTFSTAFGKIHYSVNIDNFVNFTLIFKSFKHPVNGNSIA